MSIKVKFNKTLSVALHLQGRLSQLWPHRDSASKLIEAIFVSKVVSAGKNTKVYISKLRFEIS